MAEKVSESVEAYLRSRGLEQEAMSKSALGLLVRVDEAVESRLRAAEKSRMAIKANRITITAVAEDVGVTRKTIHNNPVVHDYVNLRAREAGSPDESAVKGLRAKVADLEEQMEKLLRRDAEAEELKLELVRMREVLSERETQIRNLQNENAVLQRRLASAKAPLEKGRIIKLSSTEE